MNKETNMAEKPEAKHKWPPIVFFLPLNLETEAETSLV
jgi:hypothetical protein